MKSSEKQLRKLIREEVRKLINEQRGLPMRVRKFIGEAQYNLDQAQLELLDTELEGSQVFKDLAKADNLLKKYLD